MRAITIAKEIMVILILNKAELMWSITKRHMRKLYGQRTLTHQLQDLCKEWMARANHSELFKDPLTYLRFRVVLF